MERTDRVDSGLDFLFNPKSIALIGASTDPAKWGNQVARAMIESGYSGSLYLVNTRGGEVYGMKTYRSVNDIAGDVDVAVVGIPVRYVVDAIRECVLKRVKAAVIVTAHFGEYSEDGRKAEDEVLEMARNGGMRIVGPNCLGLYNSSNRLNTTWTTFEPGPISFATQSGNLGLEVNYLSKLRGLGFSKFISFGNQVDVAVHEYLDYLREDPTTKVILLYIEGLKDGRGFVNSAKLATQSKPVLAVKAGTCSAGIRACATHTGSMASSSDICRAAFRQTGIISADTGIDLLDIAEAMIKCPLPTGNRIAILTNGGGFGTLAADIAAKYCLEIPELSRTTKERLHQAVPRDAIHSDLNPVDFADEADWWAWERLPEVLLQDGEIDGLVIVGGFGGYEDAFPASAEAWPQTARTISQLPEKYGKPIILQSFFQDYKPQSLDILSKGGIPVYGRMDVALRCMASLVERSAYLRGLQQDQAEQPPKHPASASREASAIIESATNSGRHNLLETEARAILTAYGLPVGAYALATSAAEAADFAGRTGYPVALKIVSPDIIHKTEAGGVELDIKGEDELELAFARIIANAQAYDGRAEILGAIVAPMEGQGTEIAIGMTKDPVFGPTIMFGLGGVLVEALGDVSFRVAPLSSRDACEMIHEIRGYRVLTGVRGQMPASIDAIAAVIGLISEIVMSHPQIEEMDLNPIIVRGDSLAIVDARMILTK